MLIEQIVLAVAGLSFGMLVSGGVFTVFVSVGLVPRFADKTHTGDKILLYEDMICMGTIMGCVISVYGNLFHFNIASFWGNILLSSYGAFAGMFVGCFAIAIAEMLNTIPIFARRVGFREGLGLALLGIALGKTVGSILYFSQEFFRYGG